MVFPLGENRVFYHYSARYSLAAGIQALGLGKGDRVLVPSYNCGVEIDPFLRMDIEPVVYRVRKDLTADLADIKQKAKKRASAVLVTHYLGFPQSVEEIKDICSERNMYMIEDCAHAFLSNHEDRALGSFGDFGFFSLLKSLPLPNGGALVINNESLRYAHRPRKPNSVATLLYTMELLKQSKNVDRTIREQVVRGLWGCVSAITWSAKLLLSAFRRTVRNEGLFLVRPDSRVFLDALRGWGLSGLSRRIIETTDCSRIKAARRRNFEYVHKRIMERREDNILLRNLPEGVCPLFYPTILKSMDSRERLYQALRERGIVTHPWWREFHPAVPWAEFPEAVHLKEGLLGIPIHQDLNIGDLDFMLSKFMQAYDGVVRSK